jgi:hypothetical protein
MRVELGHAYLGRRAGEGSPWGEEGVPDVVCVCSRVGVSTSKAEAGRRAEVG